MAIQAALPNWEGSVRHSVGIRDRRSGNGRDGNE
jgi:hypothetical protein